MSTCEELTDSDKLAAGQRDDYCFLQLVIYQQKFLQKYVKNYTDDKLVLDKFYMCFIFSNLSSSKLLICRKSEMVL